HLELLDSTVVDGVQCHVLNWNLTQARFVRLQMGRHTRLRPQLGTLVRQLDGLDLLIAVTQMLPGKGAQQGDRRQRAACLSPQSQGAFQALWPYQSAQASQVSSKVVMEGGATGEIKQTSSSKTGHRGLEVTLLHLEAARLHGKLETRGVQGDAADVRSLHVQTHLTAPGPRCKPFALYVGLQVQIALQRCLV